MESAANTRRIRPALQVGLHQLPELVVLDFVVSQVRYKFPRILAAGTAALLERSAETLDRQVRHGVRSVVQHLSDHFAADSRVAVSLDFNERRNRILVYEQVIERPPGAASFLAWDAGFSRDQEPAARIRWRDLLATQELGVIRQKSLKLIL